MFFQHENRFRYKFFDIVQFSRSCKHLSRPADDLIILPQKRFFVKLFFQKLLNFPNLDVSKSLKSLWDFLTSIGSFQELLAEALEVILLPQRLALKYNTTHSHLCQHFSAAFFKFFCIHLKCTHLNVSKSVFLMECPPPWFHLYNAKRPPMQCTDGLLLILLYRIRQFILNGSQCPA